MPWKIYEEDGEFCVHKLKSDGSKGEQVACHDDRDSALKQLGALYANEPTAKIAKVDEDEQLAFGWAWVSIDKDGDLIIDSHGESIEPEDLEVAAYDYVLEARAAGELHKDQEPIGQIVESFVLTPRKAETMGLNAPGVMGWWIGVKVADEEVFAKVKSGEYKMFSIHGIAEAVEAV